MTTFRLAKALFCSGEGKPGAQKITCPPAASHSGTALGAAFFPPAAELQSPVPLASLEVPFLLDKGKCAVSLEWH